MWCGLDRAGAPVPVGAVVLMTRRSYSRSMGRFSELPEPVRLEDTITSEDVVLHDPDSAQVVDDWLLRNVGG
ncbi:MAG: hypothetical protein JWN84_675 [Nocardioides sp.]|nr:hypothetical protein [Nocardioides sp.]